MDPEKNKGLLNKTEERAPDLVEDKDRFDPAETTLQRRMRRTKERRELRSKQNCSVASLAANIRHKKDLNEGKDAPVVRRFTHRSTSKYGFKKGKVVKK